MKRLICTLLLCGLICCLPPNIALAANDHYDLDEIGISVTLPDDHIILTRNIDSDDPALDLLGMTKDDLLSVMTAQNIYLDAWDMEFGYEIYITVFESSMADYTLFSDSSLSVVASSYAKQFEGNGATLVDYSIYNHSQTKFVKIYFSQNTGENTIHGLQYHTVYDGKVYTVTLRTVFGDLNSERESILNRIVDSVHFAADPVQEEPPAPTESFVYNDPNSGLTFTVPENWVEEPMFKEREYIDAKFTSNLEQGLAIIFTCEDLLSELTPSEQLLNSRKDIDHSILTVEVAAETMACSVEEVSEITIGDKDYFLCETMTEGTMYGLTFSMPSTVLLHVENGYMFIFQFSGLQDSQYFDDFESLVASVDYSGIYQKTDSSAKDILIGSALIVAVLFVLILFIFKKSSAKRKSPVPSTQSTQIHSSEIAFCHKCGNRITKQSLFCNKCGARIPTKEIE